MNRKKCWWWMNEKNSQISNLNQHSATMMIYTITLSHIRYTSMWRHPHVPLFLWRATTTNPLIYQANLCKKYVKKTHLSWQGGDKKWMKIVTGRIFLERRLIIARINEALKRNIILGKCFWMVIHKSEERRFKENNFCTLTAHSSTECPTFFDEVGI